VHRDSGVHCLIDIIDAVGSERYKSLVQHYIGRRTCYILMFDVTNRVSFERLQYWLHQVRDSGASPLSFFVVVGNKCDLENRRCVSNKEAIEWMNRNCGVYSYYCEVSCAEKYNVQMVFEKSLDYIYENIVEGVYLKPYEAGITIMKQPSPKIASYLASPKPTRPKKCFHLCYII
jgi:GTPase SAR1 family protein